MTWLDESAKRSYQKNYNGNNIYRANFTNYSFFYKNTLSYLENHVFDGTMIIIKWNYTLLLYLMNFSKNTEDIIADFRGLPRTTTASSKRPPMQLDNLLVLLTERYKLEEPSAERTLVEHWGEIFGSIAGRCNPVRIKDDRTLVVSVTNQTLRSELQFRKRSIIKKIQSLPNCKTVCELVIRG